MATDTNQDDDAPTVVVRGASKSDAIDVDPQTAEAGRTLETRVEPAARGRLAVEGSTVDDDPTVAESPRTRRETATPISASRSGISVRQSSVSSTLTTVEDALRIEEIDRVRAFVKLGWGLTVLVIAIVPFVDGHPLVAKIMTAGLIVGIAVSYLFVRYVCTPERFSETKLVWYLGVLATLNTNIVIFYFGTFSAGPTITIIGIYFVARLESRTNAAVLVGVASLAHITCAAILMFDVMPDPALWAPSRPLTIPEMLIAEGIVQVLYVATLIAGRSARRSSVASIESLKRATGLASQREAMLAELRQDLNQALQVGGPGRYTDRELGDYKLGMLIGRGGMGEVYDATHVDTGESAAVKLLHRELLGAPKHVERFLREVEASSKFESRHVVRILAASGPEDPVPFLIMEKLSGYTLSSRLRKEHTLELADAVELAQQLGEALDEARKRGIVHRDLKPQNIFAADIDGQRVWKVLDFGVASLIDQTGTLTQGAVVGTPAYMAPEQAQGLTVDPRADVYGLAAVLFRCITGRPPFSAEDMPSLLYKVVHDPVPSLTDMADAPLVFDVIFGRALAKRPEKRFESAGQFALALQQAVRT